MAAMIEHHVASAEPLALNLKNEKQYSNKYDEEKLCVGKLGKN